MNRSEPQIVLPPNPDAGASSAESCVQGLRIWNARSAFSRPGITPSGVNWQAGYAHSTCRPGWIAATPSAPFLTPHRDPVPTTPADDAAHCAPEVRRTAGKLLLLP
jgi:hypothetical protein